MEWIDKTTSYNGKELGARIWLDKNTVLDCTLTYMEGVIEGKTRWECTPEERAALAYEISLHVCKMSRDGGMFSGGFGKFERQENTRTKRRTLKGLKDHAKTITEAHCRAIGDPQHTNASTFNEIINCHV
tara:strand:- start:62 stop:451 length:390 start_codon:yes stop_codon:yes gene_type:complete